MLRDLQKDIQNCGPLEGLDRIVMKEKEVYYGTIREHSELKRKLSKAQ